LVTAVDDREPLQAHQHEKSPKNYPKLFAYPGPKKWKGVRTRSRLSQYLNHYAVDGMEAQELNPMDWYLKPVEGTMSEDESGTNDETDVEEEASTRTKKKKVVKFRS
jgi:hypothetical protein